MVRLTSKMAPLFTTGEKNTAMGKQSVKLSVTFDYKDVVSFMLCWETRLFVLESLPVGKWTQCFGRYC